MVGYRIGTVNEYEQTSVGRTNQLRKSKEDFSIPLLEVPVMRPENFKPGSRVTMVVEAESENMVVVRKLTLPMPSRAF